MQLNSGHIAICVACLIAGLLIGLLLRGCSNKPIEPAKPVEIHDTIAIHDTAYIAGKTKVLYVTRWDTLYAESNANDTLLDTCLCDGYVTVPVMAYEYRDTFVTDSSRTELAVRFSGYDAKIDGIDLTQDWTIQPRTIEKKRGWRFFVGPSVNVGYGATVDSKRVYAGPYIGVGVSVGWGYTFKK